MRISTTFFLLCACLLAKTQDPLPPIGQWRDHLPYQSVINLSAGEGKIWAATPYSLFSLDLSDQQTNRYSRVNGLNETGISCVQMDEASGKLLIAYGNSNVDILYRNDIYNIPDIKRDNIPGDKTIYRAYPYAGDFYLSTGIGVVVLNGNRYEVKDSWFIGQGGNPVRVNGFATDAGYYYAATAEGLKRTPLNNGNPADHSAWQTISGSNGLPPGPCAHVMSLQNRVLLQKNDSLFVQNGTAWSLFYTDGWEFISSNTSGNTIQLCEKQGNLSRVVLLNPDGAIRQIIQSAPLSSPRQALYYENRCWVADAGSGLLGFGTAGNPAQYRLNSPGSVSTGAILFENNRLYAAAGAVTAGWMPAGQSGAYFSFTDGGWDNFSRNEIPALDTLPDLLSLAIQPDNGSVWAGSFSGGLLHTAPGTPATVFKQGYLGADLQDPTAFRVSGLAYDAQGNLWISNSGAVQPLRIRKKDGNWLAFNIPFTLNRNLLSGIVMDQGQFAWIVAPGGTGLICYDPGASIDNTADDRWRKINMGSGSGNLPSNDVFTATVDKNGFIWIGTADGAAVIQCPDQVFSAQGCDAVWPVVPSGNFAGYLFKGQEVRDIAVDGADRKWMATRNGVFLVSPEGEKVIYRFTEDNSPLLSNDVGKIAIDGRTGEVFFSTAKGICSFRGTATTGGEKNEDVLVFPNPVPAGYTGSIAIRGLVNNAVVKITEMDGRLVYQTRALGGQAVWDGRNYRGERVTSGAYLVLISDDGSGAISGKRERAAAKIFFISH